MAPLVILFLSPCAISLPALSIIFWHEKDVVQLRDTKFIMYELEAETKWLMFNSYQISLLCIGGESIETLFNVAKRPFHHFLARVLFGQKTICKTLFSFVRLKDWERFSEDEIWKREEINTEKKVLKVIMNILCQRWANYLLWKQRKVGRLPHVSWLKAALP